LARKRKAKGYPGKVTVTAKYNVLKDCDEYFRKIVEETAKGYPDLKYEQFIVVLSARRWS